MTFDSRSIHQPETQIVSCLLNTSGKHCHTYDTYHCVAKMNSFELGGVIQSEIGYVTKKDYIFITVYIAGNRQSTTVIG